MARLGAFFLDDTNFRLAICTKAATSAKRGTHRPSETQPSARQGTGTHLFPS